MSIPSVNPNELDHRKADSGRSIQEGGSVINIADAYFEDEDVEGSITWRELV
jgi:hypothetical protein